MKIVQFGHPLLTLRAKEVSDIDDRIRNLFIEMDKTMRTAAGIGLAAPQIAISSRLMTILEGNKTVHIANPIIKEVSGEIVMSEGCLSIPHVSLPIKRPKSLALDYLDHQGNPVTKEYSGLSARIIQHEMDHLDGKLIIDYIDEEQKQWILQSFGY